MYKQEIINAVESGRIVYAYTDQGCELVLQANLTDVFLSASGWVRWRKTQGIKFRVLTRRATRFTIDTLENAAEDSALEAEYLRGAEDWAAEVIGPDANDDWYWDIH